MMKGYAPWLCAGALALLHVLVVAIPVISSGGSGEGQALAVAIVDFPLVFLLQHVPNGTHILYGCFDCSVSTYIWFFSIIGTLMYGLFGFIIGLVGRMLFRGAVALSGKVGSWLPP